MNNSAKVKKKKIKLREIDSMKSAISGLGLNTICIEALCPNDIGDILKAVPGFDVFKIADGHYNASEPGYLTELGEQYLVLVDGMAFTNKRGRSADWATLPVQIDEIERIGNQDGRIDIKCLTGILTAVIAACWAISGLLI